jgi:hypothetical protein
MLSYKNAIMLYLLSSMLLVAGALVKIMNWSPFSSIIMLVGAIAHFASIGIGLFVFFRNQNTPKA